MLVRLRNLVIFEVLGLKFSVNESIGQIEVVGPKLLNAILDYNSDGCESCRGMGNCWENRLGQELFKYVTFAFLIQSAMVWLMHFPRKYIKFLAESEFDYFGHLIKLNEIQTAVLCGLFFSPILPLLQGVLSVLSFYQFYMVVLQKMV